MFRPTINLANSIVGVSILAMPYCFKECGVLLGALLLMSCAVMTTWSNMMLVNAANFVKKHTYGTLALASFGTVGKLATELCIIGLNFGTCVAFFVIIGDLAPPIIAQLFGLEHTAYLRAIVLVTSAVTIAFPLALLRKIDSLSSISVGSLAFYCSLIVQLMFLSRENVTSGRWLDGITWWRNAGIFKCLPIYSLAFACQPQMFAIYNDLHDPTVRKMSSIITGAVFTVGSGYMLVAVFGYLSFFQDGVQGDVLSNFSLSLLSQATRLGFALSVVLSFPLLVFPCRASINSLFFSRSSMELNVVEPIPRNRFVGITATIIGSNLLIAIVIPQVETVLALTGATMGSFICYIFPALFYLMHMHSGAEYRRRAKFLLAVGLVVSLLSTVVVLNAQVQKSEPNGRFFHPKPLPLVPADSRAEEDLPGIDLEPPAAAVPVAAAVGEENGDVVILPQDDDNPDGGGVKEEEGEEGEEEEEEGEIHEQIADLQERLVQMEKENKKLKSRQDVIEHKQILDAIDREEEVEHEDGADPLNPVLEMLEKEREKKSDEPAAMLLSQQAGGPELNQNPPIQEHKLPEPNIPQLQQSKEDDPPVIMDDIAAQELMADGDKKKGFAQQPIDLLNAAPVQDGVEGQLKAPLFPNDDTEKMAIANQPKDALDTGLEQPAVQFGNVEQSPEAELANLGSRKEDGDLANVRQSLLDRLKEDGGRGLGEELQKALEKEEEVEDGGLVQGPKLEEERRMVGRDLKSQDDNNNNIDDIIIQGEVPEIEHEGE